MELLPQEKEIQYLRVLSSSEGEEEREVDRWTGAASAGLRALCRSVMVKKESEGKGLELPGHPRSDPHLLYGHELWAF